MNLKFVQRSELGIVQNLNGFVSTSTQNSSALQHSHLAVLYSLFIVVEVNFVTDKHNPA